MSQHNWQSAAVHAFQHALHSESGKNAVKAVTVAALAAAPPALAAAAVPLAPLLFVGAVGYGFYRLFTD